MKTTKKDFELFKSETERLMKEWELNNWHPAWEHKKLADANAKTEADGSCYNVTFCLSADIDFDKFIFRQIKKEDFIKRLAKHEVIHLLLGRVMHCAEARFCTDSEMNEAEEELMRKLEVIIREGVG
jgi:hypothetical protein